MNIPTYVSLMKNASRKEECMKKGSGNFCAPYPNPHMETPMSETSEYVNELSIFITQKS